MLDMLMRILIVSGGLFCLLIAIFNDVYEDGRRLYIVNVDIITGVVLVLIGVSALYLMFSRNFYLPFLGESAIPASLFSSVPIEPSGATVSATISYVRPGAKVVFWASNPSNKDASSPTVAYGTYTNVGVAFADKNGNAILRVLPPSGYRVGFFGRRVVPHIHYRVESHPGILGEVRTMYV